MTKTVLNVCPHCDGKHGSLCPVVKAIEYFPSGKVKRIEFKSASDYWQPVPTYPNYDPLRPTWNPVTTYTETGHNAHG